MRIRVEATNERNSVILSYHLIIPVNEVNLQEMQLVVVVDLYFSLLIKLN